MYCLAHHKHQIISLCFIHHLDLRDSIRDCLYKLFPCVYDRTQEENEDGHNLHVFKNGSCCTKSCPRTLLWPAGAWLCFRPWCPDVCALTNVGMLWSESLYTQETKHFPLHYLVCLLNDLRRKRSYLDSWCVNARSRTFSFALPPEDLYSMGRSASTPCHLFLGLALSSQTIMYTVGWGL